MSLEVAGVAIGDEGSSFYAEQDAEELEQVGRFGLHLLDELKSKNRLIEELSRRLRQICSDDNESFFVSQDPISTPVPQLVVNDYMERADLEIARLDEIVEAQTAEIERLKYESSMSEILWAEERERFKSERIKFKRDLLEMNMYMKQRNNCFDASNNTDEDLEKLKLKREIIELNLLVRHNSLNKKKAQCDAESGGSVVHASVSTDVAGLMKSSSIGSQVGTQKVSTGTNPALIICSEKGTNITGLNLAVTTGTDALAAIATEPVATDVFGLVRVASVATDVCGLTIVNMPITVGTDASESTFVCSDCIENLELIGTLNEELALKEGQLVDFEEQSKQVDILMNQIELHALEKANGADELTAEISQLTTQLEDMAAKVLRSEADLAVSVERYESDLASKLIQYKEELADVAQNYDDELAEKVDLNTQLYESKLASVAKDHEAKIAHMKKQLEAAELLKAEVSLLKVQLNMKRGDNAENDELLYKLSSVREKMIYASSLTQRLGVLTQIN